MSERNRDAFAQLAEFAGTCEEGWVVTVAILSPPDLTQHGDTFGPAPPRRASMVFREDEILAAIEATRIFHRFMARVDGDPEALVETSIDVAIRPASEVEEPPAT